MELVLLIGIPAAGKSTFYRRHLASTHFRVNLDTLKKRPRELRVVEGCIAERKPFAVDNTNVLAYDRARYIPLAKAAGYRVVGYRFDCRVDDALDRNSGRSGDAWVPPHVIYSFHAKFEPPAWDEGFDELHRVMIVDNQFVVKRMRRKPKFRM
jgi:predicted kinase